MSQWIYLSYLINSKTPAYGNGDTFNESPGSMIQNGDSSNTSIWKFPNHIGTHIDFPLHFMDEGMSFNDFSPSFWISNKVFIRDISRDKDVSKIDIDSINIHEIPKDIEVLLIKTGFCYKRSTKEYWGNGPVFMPGIANALRKDIPSLRIYGIDTISISSWTDRTTGRRTHLSFLARDNPILLLEDIDLTKVDANTKFKQLIISPLMVDKSNGSPCTVFAELE